MLVLRLAEATVTAMRVVYPPLHLELVRSDRVNAGSRSFKARCRITRYSLSVSSPCNSPQSEFAEEYRISLSLESTSHEILSSRSKAVRTGRLSVQPRMSLVAIVRTTSEEEHLKVHYPHFLSSSQDHRFASASLFPSIHRH